jgi:hypothetical protein
MTEVQSAGIETSLLSHYGKAIAEYPGKGSVTLEDGRQMQCTFLAGQLAAGDVLLLCEFQEFILDSHPVAKSFEGTTDKGHLLNAQQGDNGRGITWCPFLPNREGCWHAFHVWELKVEMVGGVTETKAVRFGLTNLTFDPPDVDKSGQSCLRLVLESASDRTELSIVRLPGYDKIVEYFRIRGATDLTSEAVIDTAETTNTEHLENVVDNLCHLLSVARGTLIQWIYLDFCDGNGRSFERRHYSRRTKPYNSHELLDSNQPAETKEFLQQSYKTYAAKRDPYRLNKGLIISYLEAKASDDNIERKGIKLAVTLEMLKTVYLEQPENPTKEFVANEDKFNPLIPSIQASVDEVLKKQAIDKCLRSAICAERKILGLNRRSFRHVLEKLCKEIGLDVPSDQMERFVECRNSLIHRGRFHCTTTTPPDNSFEGMLNEFGFMLNLVDRIFLKLLGYGGRYRDWTFPMNTVLRNQV